MRLLENVDSSFLLINTHVTIAVTTL
jgi:hypothetical protein